MPPPKNQWRTLDKDLGRLGRLGDATLSVAGPLVAPGLALGFVVFCSLMALGAAGGAVLLAAATIAAYMALNIGANDVANNMGPAVGARVLTLPGALLLAALCETAGALVAGGDVVETLASGLVDPAAFADPGEFVRAMMAALLGAALWINLATWLGAPVSTTHSIVGGIVGAGVVAGGAAAVNGVALGEVALSWVISPVLGGAIAAALLGAIKARLKGPDRIGAARRWLPRLIGAMAGIFAAYLALTVSWRGAQIAPAGAAWAGLALGLAAWVAARPLIARQAAGLDNRGKSVKALFALPLVLAAALLSFAHGANDVANAVGPLAAIVRAVQAGAAGGGGGGSAPLWVMLVGALGISVGLLLFGPKLIRLVGSEITRLNPLRGACVALATAVTVLLASGLGLPVSSTHITVGAVFGVGFYREWDAARRLRRAGARKAGPGSTPPGTTQAGTTPPGTTQAGAGPMPLAAAPRPDPQGGSDAPEERRRRRLVRRAHLLTLAAAWTVTVPVAALLSAGLFLALRALG